MLFLLGMGFGACLALLAAGLLAADRRDVIQARYNAEVDAAVLHVQAEIDREWQAMQVAHAHSMTLH